MFFGSGSLHPQERATKRMKIRPLSAPTDTSQFREIRIESAREAPESFRATEEEMRSKSIEEFECQLTARDGGALFVGAFKGSSLVGVAALFFESSQKLSHKATVGSVFVNPTHRKNGIGRALVSELLSIAREDKKLLQLNLAVNTTNTTAVELYKSLGFAIFGTEPNAVVFDGESHDEHHMQCVL